MSAGCARCGGTPTTRDAAGNVRCAAHREPVTRNDLPAIRALVGCATSSDLTASWAVTTEALGDHAVALCDEVEALRAVATATVAHLAALADMAALGHRRDTHADRAKATLAVALRAAGYEVA